MSFVVRNSILMTGANTDRKGVREAVICESPQLAVKVACRCLAFERFNVIPIQNREGEDSLWTLYS
jgi:hypothetical protein